MDKKESTILLGILEGAQDYPMSDVVNSGEQGGIGD